MIMMAEQRRSTVITILPLLLVLLSTWANGASLLSIESPADRSGGRVARGESTCKLPTDFAARFYVPDTARPCAAGGKLAPGQSCRVKCAQGYLPSAPSLPTATFECTVGHDGVLRLVGPKFYWFCLEAPCDATARRGPDGWECNRAQKSGPQKGGPSTASTLRGELAAGTVCAKACPGGTFGPGITSTCVKGQWTKPQGAQFCERTSCAASQRRGTAGWKCTGSPDPSGFLPEGTQCTLGCPAGKFGAAAKTSKCLRGRWSDTDGQCTACTGIALSKGAVACTNALNSVRANGFSCNPGYEYRAPANANTAGACVACPANATGAPKCACNQGFFGTLTPPLGSGLWTGTCTACTPIANGAGPITCTSATNSQAGTGFACSAGMYLQDNTGSTADVCTACTPIANGAGPITCSSATNSQAGTGFACSAGRYLQDNTGSTADVCTACTPIANGAGPITCSSATDSQAGTGFACSAGMYLQDNTGSTADVCTACTPIANGAGPITCSSATDSQAGTGFACSAGTYFQDNTGSTADVCAACTPIANGTGSVTCTGATDSQAETGFVCSSGTFFQNNTGSSADVCTACTPITGGTGPINCTNNSDSRGILDQGFRCRAAVLGDGDDTPGYYFYSGASSDECRPAYVVYFNVNATNTQRVDRFEIVTVGDSDTDDTGYFLYAPVWTMTVTVASGPPGGYVELVGQFTGIFLDNPKPKLNVTLGAQTTGDVSPSQEGWMRYPQFIRMNVGETATISGVNPAGEFMQLQALGFNVYPNM